MRLDRFSIRTRLLVCVFLPFAGLLVLGALLLQSYSARHERMEAIVDHTQAVRLASDLIDSLQAERGTSAGFIGSAGTKMESEMASARSATNAAIMNFAPLKTDGYADLVEQKAIIDEKLAEIGSIRERIDTLMLSGADAFSYFTATVTDTAELSTQLSLGIQEPELARRLHSYGTLLAAKEQAGRQRGLGTGAIGAGRFMEDKLIAFVDATGGKNTLLDSYLMGLEASERKSVQEALRAAGLEDMAKLIARMVSGGVSGDLSALEPAAFFSLATQQIKVLKGLEKNKLDTIEAYAVEARAEAYHHEVVAGALGLGVLVVVLATAILFTRSITVPLARLNLCMEKLSRGDVDMSLISTGGSDEIARLAKSVEGFVSLTEDGVRKRREADETVERQRNAEREKHQNEQAAKAHEVADAVEALQNGLSALASGNLSYRINRSLAGELDRLRSDFNQATSQLETTLQSVQQVSRTVATGVDELSAASHDLARRTENQAVTIETASAALSQIASTVTANAGRADRAGKLVNEASEFARSSSTVVTGSIKAMEEIAQSSREISKIIGVIDEITFQTSLLALNAGVEAARAGEAGKGFAVVAQEVRELANRSASAASEIKGLIARSVGSVDQGVSLFGQTGEALNGILGRVDTVREEMSSIVEATREQASAIRHVNQSIGEIDQATQNNAAMVEEAAAATQTLGEEAARLANEVARFKLSAERRRPDLSRAA